MERLKGKVALITGGNSGIGEATAEFFAREGAKVVISARRVEKLEAVANKIKAAGGEVVVAPCDIADAAQCDAAVAKTIEAFGTVDILVNNAGVVDSAIEAIEKASDDNINKLIDTNAKGTIYMTRAAAKIMMEKKSGSIVNVSSIAGYTGSGGAAYAASKGAVIALTKNIAMRSAAIGVRCNALCPGTVVTPMVAGMKKDELDMDMMGAMAKHCDMSIPPCKAEEIANAILFLASDEASAVNGQIIAIDHGANI